MVLSKIDLLPYMPFDVAAARQNAQSIHPAIETTEVSSLSGTGLETWRA